MSSEEVSPLEGATKPERSMRQTLVIAAISLAVILGIYAYVGTRDRSLDIDHAALLFEEQLDGLVCCSVYHETGDAEYLLVITREIGGEFRQVVLRVMQLDEEGRPAEINAIGSPFDSLLPTSFAVVDHVVHIPLFGDDQAGVWSIDLSDPAWPESIGFVHTGSGFSRQLAASDEGLVAINHTEQFVLVDLSNPHGPDIVSQMEQPVSGSIGLQLNDARLYVNDGDADVIRIVDASDWFAPTEVGSHVNPDGPGEVPIELGVLDAAERLDATAIPGRFLDFAVDGELLYVAASDLGLKVIDVSDPQNTEVVGTVDTPDRVIRVALDTNSDRLYLLGGSEEDRDRLSYAIHTLDISDRANPVLLETINGIAAEPGLQAFSTGGGYLFVGLDETLLVFDASE